MWMCIGCLGSVLTSQYWCYQLKMMVGTHLGPHYLWWAPTDITEPQQVLWLDQPYSSYYDYKTNLSNSYQGTLKKQGLLLMSSKGYTACLRAHSEFVRRERGRERERVHGPGVLTLLELRVGCPGFSSFTLYQWI